MNQICLLLGLYILGLFFGLLFKKRIGIEVICSTALLWGGLFWVVSALFLLSFSISYDLLHMLIILGSALVVILYFLIHNRLWRMSLKEILWMVGSVLAFLLVLVAGTIWNYSAGTLDSISKIMIGKSFAYDGIINLNQHSLGMMGSFMMIIQSISVFIHDDYVYLAEPAFAFSLFFTFITLGKQILLPKIKNWLFFTILVLGLFISTYFVRLQIFYIHDAIFAGTYLLISLASFWLCIREENPTWLVPGTLGMLGFSLTRVEAPVFVICFLAIVISLQKIPKKLQMSAFLPLLALIILWYTRIFFTLNVDGKQLNTGNMLVTLGGLVCFGLYAYLSSKITWVEEKITPKLRRLIIPVLFLALILFFILAPDHTYTDIYSTIVNIYVRGLWGSTSIVLTFLLIFLPLPKTQHPEDQIFTKSIVAFLLIMLLIGNFRGTYRLNWSDSANRMLMHILPTACLYLLIRFRNITEATQNQIDELVIQKRNQFLAAGSFLLIIIFSVILVINMFATST